MLQGRTTRTAPRWITPEEACKVAQITEALLRREIGYGNVRKSCGRVWLPDVIRLRRHR
jgi:hypothetical protein